MKTDKNSQSPRSEHPIQTEQASTDNNQKEFHVFLHCAHYSSTHVIIEANSREEALASSKKIDPTEIDAWEPFDCKVSVASIELFEGDTTREAAAKLPAHSKKLYTYKIDYVRMRQEKLREIAKIVFWYKWGWIVTPLVVLVLLAMSVLWASKITMHF